MSSANYLPIITTLTSGYSENTKIAKQKQPFFKKRVLGKNLRNIHENA